MSPKYKKVIVFAAILVLWPTAQYALDLEVGMVYGRRMVADPKIRGVYGNGTVYDPFLAVRLWKGLAVGLDYEGGYSRTGKIGTYQEPTNLKVTGPEFFVRYAFNLKFVSPFVKVGYGSYSYRQTIESPYIAGHVVDGTKSSPSIGAGLRFFPVKFLFLSAELKYVPLKVKPFEVEVDLGGVRYLVGAGFRFAF
jgi:hypothetical protein